MKEKMREIMGRKVDTSHDTLHPSKGVTTGHLDRRVRADLEAVASPVFPPGKLGSKRESRYP